MNYNDFIVITNRNLVEGDFIKQLEKIAKLKPYALILREKDLSENEYYKLAVKVQKICEKNKIKFFIHSHVQIAKKLGVKNIHLSIPNLKNITNIVNTEDIANTTSHPNNDKYVNTYNLTYNDKLTSIQNPLLYFENISISCHSMEDVNFAIKSNANQIILGTIFETECKKGLKGKGLSFVKEITANCPIPVYAIGGIKEDNIAAIKKAGAKGGCMMSGFMKY